jgi:hypothetical protein
MTMQIKLTKNSIVMSKVLETIHPGGIRTHDFLFLWRRRWPLDRTPQGGLVETLSLDGIRLGAKIGKVWIFPVLFVGSKIRLKNCPQGSFDFHLFLSTLLLSHSGSLRREKLDVFLLHSYAENPFSVCLNDGQKHVINSWMIYIHMHAIHTYVCTPCLRSFLNGLISVRSKILWRNLRYEKKNFLTKSLRNPTSRAF